MLVILFVLPVHYFVTPAIADWTIYKQTEVRSIEKHRLRFDHDLGGPVRAWLILKSKKSGVFESKLPLYQVDDNEVHDLQLIEKGRRVNKDRWVLWEIYGGKGPLSDALLEFMNGKEVTFQYYLPDGTIKETTFNLEGAKEAINEILK